MSKIYLNNKLLATVKDQNFAYLFFDTVVRNCNRGDVIKRIDDDGTVTTHNQKTINLHFERVPGRFVLHYTQLSNNYEEARRIANKAGGRALSSSIYGGGFGWWWGEWSPEEVTETIDNILYNNK